MRTPLALLAAATIALSLACGDDDPAPAPGPAGQDPGGSPTTAAPGLSPEPPAPPPGESPPPPPAPPGTPPPGQRLVTVERLDGAAECDGLVPSRVPEPVTARVESPGGLCRGGISDGTGHVSVELAPSLPWGERQTFSPEGAPRQRFLAYPSFAAQADGWLQAVGEYSHGPSPVRLVARLPDGTHRRTETFSPVYGRDWELGADPRGGGFLVTYPFRFSSTDPCTGEGRRFDAAGVPVGAAASVGCNVRAAGVSTLGDALALEGTAAGRSILHWVRPDGSHARPPADEGDTVALLDRWNVELAPLLDGSLAARTDAGWTRRYRHLAASGEAPPAWLAARGTERFRFTRGNRGYAFFPAPGQASADCRQAIELLAPSGRRCVRVTFREDGTGCTTGAIDQGWDGTVVQQSGRDACTYRWWPRLLGE